MRIQHAKLLLVGTLATTCLFGLSACSPITVPAATQSADTAATEPTQLTVFAPSSLTEATKQLGAGFEAAQPGANVLFEVGHTRPSAPRSNRAPRRMCSWRPGAPTSRRWRSRAWLPPMQSGHWPATS